MIHLFFGDQKYNPIKVEKMHQLLNLLHMTSWIMSPMQLSCKDIYEITEKTAQMILPANQHKHNKNEQGHNIVSVAPKASDPLTLSGMAMISCHYTPQTSSVPTSEGKQVNSNVLKCSCKYIW
jgi:hypothetical protein